MRIYFLQLIFFEIFILTCFFSIASAYAQSNQEATISFQGVVLDSANSKPLSYVAIGIINTSTGIISAEDGSFSLIIPQDYSDDSIKFSYVGYHRYAVAVADIRTDKTYTIRLKPSVNMLSEILVFDKLPKKVKKLILGTKRASPFSFLSYGIRNQESNKGAEAALLMNPKSKQFYIEKLQIYIKNKEQQDVKFLVHIYSINEVSKMPDKLLLSRKVSSEAMKRGWVTLDVSDAKLLLECPFFVSFQWIDMGKDIRSIPMISVKNTKQGLMRTNALGKWRKTRTWAIKALGKVYKK